MGNSIYPIDLSLARTRWCAYNSEDAKRYATALITAGINYTCHYTIVTAGIEQWCFDRITEN